MEASRRFRVGRISTLPPIKMEPDRSWKTIFLLKGLFVRFHVNCWDGIGNHFVHFSRQFLFAGMLGMPFAMLIENILSAGLTLGTKDLKDASLQGVELNTP